MTIPNSEKAMAAKAASFLKIEMKRVGLTYPELADCLEEHGLHETEASIANKLTRGTFAATFFLATLKAMGTEQLLLSDV